MKVNIHHFLVPLVLVSTAGLTAWAVAGQSTAPGIRSACGTETLDHLVPGTAFAFARDLVADMDLKAVSERVPATETPGASEIYTIDETPRLVSWSGGNQSEISCVVVRSASTPWRFARSAGWKLKSSHVYTQASIGSQVGASRAPKENVYVLGLESRDKQKVSVQCTAHEVGHGPWDPRHNELTIGTFQGLYDEVFHPGVKLEADPHACPAAVTSQPSLQKKTDIETG
jgi:hypothetical protein